MDDMPPTAAWRHCGSRTGFEVVFTERTRGGHRIDGESTGVEDGEAWRVGYAVRLDGEGRTRTARVAGRSARGPHAAELEGDGEGRWWRDGERARELDGCLDVDLEASAFTNALAVRRLGLTVGQAADAPAAWVRTLGLAVERLEQRYERVENRGQRHRYDYAAPALGFRAELLHDERGLSLEYPGLAVRVL